MANTYFDRYLEAGVLSADAVKLVWLMYRGAIDAVRTARECLADGDIRGRTRQINRAWGILRELSSKLDHSHGAEVTQNLANLYAYMQGRLIEANVKQAAEPLEEVISLLTTLAEAWENVSQSTGRTREPIAAPHTTGYLDQAPDAGEHRTALALG